MLPVKSGDKKLQNYYAAHFKTAPAPLMFHAFGLN